MHCRPEATPPATSAALTALLLLFPIFFLSRCVFPQWPPNPVESEGDPIAPTHYAVRKSRNVGSYTPHKITHCTFWPSPWNEVSPNIMPLRALLINTKTPVDTTDSLPFGVSKRLHSDSALLCRTAQPHTRQMVRHNKQFCVYWTLTVQKLNVFWYRTEGCVLIGVAERQRVWTLGMGMWWWIQTDRQTARHLDCAV